MEKKLYFHSINGRNSNLNYEQFYKSIESVFAKHNTCRSAKFFVFNNFPIVLSTKMQMDLLLIIAIENTQGNYYKVKNSGEGKAIYFYNQIIPITIVTDYEDSNPYLDEDGIIRTANEDIDYSDEIKEMGKGLLSYLQDKVGLKENIYINPLIFVKNNRNKIICNNYLVAPNLDFENLNEYFWKNKQDIFNSYEKWRLGYDFIELDIRKIIDQASKDSKYGYLTKKKIELLIKQHNNIRGLSDELGNYLVSIQGKAGTGKSSMLLSIAQKLLKDNGKVLFLTYNKLLVYDISLLMHRVVTEIRSKGNTMCCFATDTLHGFFYHLSKKLRVTLLMTGERVQELQQTLKERMERIYPILQDCMNLGYYKDRLTYIQNTASLNEGEKEEAIEFLKWNRECNKQKKKEYIEYKGNLIRESLHKEIFLKDYENVLKNLYKAIKYTPIFYEEFYVKNRYDIFTESYINKNELGQEVKNTVTEEGFTELVDRSIKAKERKGRIIFVDEAQDCYSFEKDILIKIFEKSNIVIANGEKEQLIRYKKLCNWKVSQGQKIKIKSHTLRPKSFRTKKAIIDFCKFVSQKAGIDWILSPMDSNDEGEIIFDFRQRPDVIHLFNELKAKGSINQCRSYESILTLIEPSSEISSQTTTQPENIRIDRINENNVVKLTKKNEKKGEWEYFKTLEDNGFSCYNGTEKKKLIYSFDDIRLIHYESCRGLEAWSVCCFRLDRFFQGKYEDENADNYLLEKMLDDFDKVLDAEKRKKIYATNWLLMSLTRAMDTLYIQIEDKDSYLGQIIKEYIDTNKGNKSIKVFDDNIISQQELLNKFNSMFL